jgi:hypothetical protein
LKSQVGRSLIAVETIVPLRFAYFFGVVRG